MDFWKFEDTMIDTTIELFLDIVNRVLVTSASNPSQVTLANIYQYDQIRFKIWPVRPNSTGSFDYLTSTSIVCSVAFGPRSAAAATAKVVLDQVIADVNGPVAYTGVLNLNTVDVNALITGKDALDSYLEIKLVDSGTSRIRYQSPITMYAVVDDEAAGSAIPTPAPDYLTRAEALSMFVSYAPDARANGKCVITRSPDGTVLRSQGVDNNRAPIDDIIG
jgi:hypothetical protein